MVMYRKGGGGVSYKHGFDINFPKTANILNTPSFEVGDYEMWWWAIHPIGVILPYNMYVYMVECKACHSLKNVDLRC